MRGYGQMCPVARASELFAERWTPLILLEILAGRRHFNEIQQGYECGLEAGGRRRRLLGRGRVGSRCGPVGRPTASLPERGSSATTAPPAGSRASSPTRRHVTKLNRWNAPVWPTGARKNWLPLLRPERYSLVSLACEASRLIHRSLPEEEL